MKLVRSLLEIDPRARAAVWAMLRHLPTDGVSPSDLGAALLAAGIGLLQQDGMTREACVGLTDGIYDDAAVYFSGGLQ